MTPSQRATAITAAAAIQGVEPALLTQSDLDALAAFVAHCTTHHARPNAGARRRSKLSRKEQVAAATQRHRAKKKDEQSAADSLKWEIGQWG